MSDVISKSAFAGMLGVTPGRVSQFLSEKKIYGDALVGEGRRARIRSSVAIEQLKRTLDIDQRLGANARAQLDLPAAAPPRADHGTASPPPNSLEEDLRRERLEQLQLGNEKSREERAARAGLYVKAADARQELGRVAGRMMAIFEGALGEMATAVAAASNLPYRDALILLRASFRTIRARSEQTESQAASELPKLEERAADEDDTA